MRYIFPLTVVVCAILIAGWYALPRTIPEDASSFSKTPTYVVRFPVDPPLLSYMRFVSWPPVSSTTKAAYSCAQTSQGAPAGSVLERIIEGVQFCIREQHEGAAGSVYSRDAYTFSQGNTVTTISFTIQKPQCMDYDEEKRGECIAEQERFNPDSFARSGLVETYSPHTDK